MLDCLTGYVGLKGCGEPVPASGLYINTLPGIDTSLLDKIASPDQITYKGVWDDIQALAQQEILFDITAALKDRYKIRTLLRSTNIGVKIDTGVQTIAAANYRGYSVDLCKYLPDGYTFSNMVVHNVDSLMLYLPAVTVNEFDIKIFDGVLLTELFSYTLEPTNQVAGWNTIPVNRAFAATKLIYCYDSTEVNSVGLALPSTINDSLCGCFGNMYSGSCPGEVKGIISTDLTGVGTVTEGSDTYGLTGVISIACSLSSLVCSNKLMFSKPYQLLLGSKLMEMALNTDRFGAFNTTKAEKTRSLMENYHQDYISTMKVVLKGLELDDADPCIDCDAPIKLIYQYP